MHLRGSRIGKADLNAAAGERPHQAFRAFHGLSSPSLCGGKTAKNAPFLQPPACAWQPCRAPWRPKMEEMPMPLVVLYAETLYPDHREERRIFGPDVEVRFRDAADIGALAEEDCAAADGLMVMRHFLTRAHIARFPRLRAVVRMGVGYDRIDRAELADHAIALALALRRGIALYHDTQRADPPAGWVHVLNPMIRRAESLTFGIIGLGRIGTAVALRAKAFGYRVLAYDPHQPNGVERGLGIGRARTLEELLSAADTLSIHAPLTKETKGMLGRKELALLPQHAVVINTARGPILDLDALEELLREGHIAGAGLDVLPQEPPVEPLPGLLKAYRAREPWLEGRLIITPHAAFYSPEAWHDIRIKSAETMRAALLGPHPQNVITPDMY